MNVKKRKVIDAIIVLVESVTAAEVQDLKDTPDSIEFSDACKEFHSSIAALSKAQYYLNEARNVTHGRADD